VAYTVRFGGKDGTKISLREADDLIAVRTRLGPSIGRAIRTRAVARALGETERIAHFPEVGVEVLRVRADRSKRRARDRIRGSLKKETGIAFAGRVLQLGRSPDPVLYTENLFVKFDARLNAQGVKRVLRRFHLEPKRRLKQARNAWFVGAKEGIGFDIFRLYERLLALPEVELCHPELVRRVARRRAFPQQWHLHKTRVKGRVIDAHANVESAWRLSRGKGVVIAVIDDGVDVDHEEFSSRRKIVAPRDVTGRRNDARPVFSGILQSDDHGTACAGVACADGRFGASGVAPGARLMPIRLNSGLGSMNEADAFVWAADHGADVISCSWGPPDGDWWDPRDPLHKEEAPIPDSTRLAIDYAMTKGRGGKGCTVTWAAGNGNESVDNDGYASYPPVVAVAATNDRNKRSVYSDYGKAVWCAFPSDDAGPPEPRTPGIWTTDRSGAQGYNPGRLSANAAAPGDRDGDYANDFGGTSSACPGVAGVVALMLEENPALTPPEIKDLLRRCARKIDRAGGRYKNGRSPFYGWGRLDARRAVELARAANPARKASRKKTARKRSTRRPRR
jgi:subtilisin family serine protease